MVRTYARQQTVEPLRGVGRWVAFGLFGGVLMTIGLVFLGLGALRGLQSLDAFDGGWSFAPYFIVLSAAIVILAATRSRIFVTSLHPRDMTR